MRRYLLDFSGYLNFISDEDIEGDRIFIGIYNGAKWFNPGIYLVQYSYTYIPRIDVVIPENQFNLQMNRQN